MFNTYTDGINRVEAIQLTTKTRPLILKYLRALYPNSYIRLSWIICGDIQVDSHEIKMGSYFYQPKSNRLIDLYSQPANLFEYLWKKVEIDDLRLTTTQGDVSALSFYEVMKTYEGSYINWQNEQYDWNRAYLIQAGEDFLICKALDGNAEIIMKHTIKKIKIKPLEEPTSNE